MTKLEYLNSLLSDRTLDIPNCHRTVDNTGGNMKWLKKHIAARNGMHPSFLIIMGLLNEGIGSLVTLQHKHK